MGDCGSLLLGFVLAVFSLLGLSEGATLIALFVPIIILGIPVLDTFFAIIRRRRQHKPVFQADKGHFHHQLLDLGLSHKDTVLFIYAITLLFGTVAVLITLLPSFYSVIVFVLALILIFAGSLKLGIFGERRNTEE